MSRYVKQAADKTLIYGHDHALGYFYEEWLTAKMNEDEDRPFSDKCQMFGMQTKDMLEKMHQYRCKEVHIKSVEANQPF